MKGEFILSGRQDAIPPHQGRERVYVNGIFSRQTARVGGGRHAFFFTPTGMVSDGEYGGRGGEEGGLV